MRKLISEISPILKENGFIKYGNAFFRSIGGNYGVVNFQKSTTSLNGSEKFTINFGVYSKALAVHLNENSSGIRPKVSECHWIARIGDFIHGSPDLWWYQSSIEEVLSNLVVITKYFYEVVFPEIEKRISDDGLIENWINGGYTGTTDFCKFRYLTTLLFLKEETTMFNGVIDSYKVKWKGKPLEKSIQDHLITLGSIQFR